MSLSTNNIRHAAKFSALTLSSLLLVCVAVLPAHSAEKTQEISRVIAKEMTAAQKAMQASQWAEAIKNLEAAETKSPLTSFDKMKIYDFKGFAYLKLNNLKASEAAYEAAIATGAYSPEETAKIDRVLFRLAATNQQFPKAIEFGKQAAELGTASTDDVGVISQLYFVEKDCKDSIIWADKAIAASKKAGEAPKENVYQFKLQCASDAGDSAGEVAALVDLIRLTNKTTYWNDLLRVERNDERDDRNTLMIYRLMFDTNSMSADTDYFEMAQLLGDAALPGEAAAVMDKALSTPGVMKDEHKERATRLLTSLKARADTDKKGLAQLDAEAAKNPAGELSVKTGEVHFGFGDYPAAVTAINAGIQKGQVKHLDEAYIYLGRSLVAQKNFADAKKALAQLKTVPNISPRVLKIWDLYGEKLGSAQQ
jgi:tetratricopeptide (TPR) repeat protein